MMLNKAIKFTDDSHLAGALKITLCGVIPFLIFMPYQEFNWAFAMAVGALLTAPVDIPSNIKDKIGGLLVGAFTVPAVTLVLSLTLGHWFFYPVFAFVFFSLSMIAVYGHRANLLSFSGLLAASLGLAYAYEGQQLWMHVLMLLLGGLLYLVVAIIFYYARPRRYGVLLTSDCMELTSKYLRYRANLWSPDADVTQITAEQLNIQIQLNEVHENLREFVVRNKANTGNSSNNRRLLVAFTALVEILEIAVSSSFDHKRLQELFKSDPSIIKNYQKLAYGLADTIQTIGESLNMGLKYEIQRDLLSQLESLEKQLSVFSHKDTSKDKLEAILMFTNVLHYAQEQIDKIIILERTLVEKVFTKDVETNFKDLEKFLTPVHYQWQTLVENLNFNSTIFRHATRLTLTVLAGLIISEVFNLLNGYWILLTIVVIMRPGYGLTKQRSFERVIGTVAGGLIAFGLLYLIQENVQVLAYLVVLSMILGYWFSHTDYKVGVTFVTIYVVLIYGILSPNFMDLLVYRIIDTFIGALLAFGANYLLWPSWEFLKVNVHLANSVKANREYVKEISILYNEKGQATLPYKLARKYAFIETGNLMASFQRMIQEPKSKQTLRPEIYELAVLNHTFLSTAASIGVYVQSSETTKASDAFNTVTNYIDQNLKLSIDLLEQETIPTELISAKSKEDYSISINYLQQLRKKELERTCVDQEQLSELMKESILVIEQLSWLAQLSEKILKATTILTQKKKEHKASRSYIYSRYTKFSRN
ncbi:FUSC family protein [Myroides sp. LJL116]